DVYKRQSPASATGEILDLVPEEKLVLSWFMEADGVDSTASFELEDAAGGGTLLRFVHSGLPQEPEWLPRFNHVALEWDKVLLNLRFVLEEKGEGKHLFYFRTSVLLHAPQARIFRAWLTATGLNAWLARDLLLVPEEGQEMSGVTIDMGRALSVHFHRIEPDKHLRMTWSEGGVRGLIGVSFWPVPDGIDVTLTLRSFALMEGERPIIQSLWDRRFQRLARYLARRPFSQRPAAGGSIDLSRELESTPQRAWAALTDAAILRRWFVAWTDFEPRPGAEYTVLWNNYGELQGRIEEARPGEFLRLTWDLAELEATTEVLSLIHISEPTRQR
ncbi:MAG: SRPBCC domain-containing protein, partial [Candidatus Eisenbacteria bacterium]|nr:SRPBCC domain-containing protein [Candidatus Eisenbacteria bacterium]